MGACLLYPHSVLQFPSVSAFRKPYFPIREISDRSLVLSVRADDGKKGRHKKNPYSGRAPKTEGADDTAQSFEGKSSLSPNKEEILALFKRIQSSISKGETVNPKKRTSKTVEDKPSPSAESILEVLHQSRTQRKGKSVGKKGDKFLDTQKESLKEESAAEHISTRPPSSFTRRSPIPSLSSPREQVQSGNETIPATPTELTNEISESIDDDSDHQTMKLAEMKLPQLKEVAKSKGIKGYSKLKKSELVELLIKSLTDASP
ncbi:SAP-like protein BP-73 [Salvia miltiorrhiza]|uniref:SAP-like protein BP-73 n=1 Tax=Salvia miltiorrhiza TaxID=226208 RepID=UPI0025ACEF3C|nr:SAP-like protein BP-73 [Salvia miltiorrhiza]